MGIFDPNDFSDDPYAGGLNQAMHAALGAAFSGVAMYFGAGFIAGALAALISAILWELNQVKNLGARIADAIADVAYWSFGGVVWAAAIHYGQVTGYAILFPVLLCLLWVVEFARISWREM